MTTMWPPPNTSYDGVNHGIVDNFELPETGIKTKTKERSLSEEQLKLWPIKKTTVIAKKENMMKGF
jgi:hypothetical protein